MNYSLLVIAGAVLLLIPKESNAAVIFTEKLGTVADTNIADIETANGFDNDGFEMSGSGELRTTTASSGYADASGGANVFLSEDAGKNFRISGINTTGYTAGSLDISFGAYKAAIASTMAELKFSYSTNGTDFTQIAIPAQATGSGTALWRLLSFVNTSLPIANSLTLKWEQDTVTTSAFRIDDIKLEGTPIPEPTAAALMLASLGMVLRRRRA